jgi:type I restriction enzyme, S subunit
MRLADFFENFEVLAAAPGGVARLREAVLGLAVRGRLVAQDPADEPAAVLLERIAVERSRLVKEKKIKASKPLPPVSLDEVPFDLPVGWEWERLGRIGQINPRNEANDDNFASFVPMALVPTDHNGSVQYEERKWKDIKKGFTHFADDDVIFAKITPCFQNRKSAVIRELVNGVGAGTTELYVFRSISGLIYSRYVLIYVRSPRFIQGGEETFTGTAGQQRVPKSYFAENPFPVPPLAEQKRIVEAVDRLMEQLDRLEAQQTQQRDRLQILGTTATTQLTGAAETRDRVWPLVRDRFATIYDTPENVEQLRQTILQLAVMGRLVPQDPNDEPASVLLERIRAEKARLIKEKKIKPSKQLPPISPDEMPFNLPVGWEWTQLDQVLSYGPKNGVSPKPVDYETPQKSLTLTATTSGIFNPNHFKYINFPVDSSSDLWLEKDDILIQRGNTLEYVGVAAIFDGERQTFLYPDLMMKIKMISLVHTKYAHRVINSFYSRCFFEARASGTSGSMPKINQQIVRSLPFPLPPLAEQKRIVATVDRLMTHCDQLQTQLQTRSDLAHTLLHSAIHQLSQTP